MKINSGFTLIEILVAMSIMAIMFLFLVVNFQGNQNNRDIKSDGLLLLDGIKRMQTMALSGPNSGGQSPVSYEFFANACSSGCSYDLKGNYPDAPLVSIDTVDLKNSKVSIVNAAGDQAGTKVTITFNMPRAVAVIEVDDTVKNDVILKLEHIKSSGAFIYIKINGISGRMDITNTL